jgi:hypothetical protein
MRETDDRSAGPCIPRNGPVLCAGGLAGRPAAGVWRDPAPGLLHRRSAVGLGQLLVVSAATPLSPARCPLSISAQAIPEGLPDSRRGRVLYGLGGQPRQVPGVAPRVARQGLGGCTGCCCGAGGYIIQLDYAITRGLYYGSGARSARGARLLLLLHFAEGPVDSVDVRFEGLPLRRWLARR